VVDQTIIDSGWEIVTGADAGARRQLTAYGFQWRRQMAVLHRTGILDASPKRGRPRDEVIGV
jgi:hypothetical protein